MYWPKIETPKLRINDKLSGPIIIITGIIVSLWTNCIFVTAVVYRFSFDGPTGFLITVGLITHMIISVSATSFLNQGFREADPSLLKPWLITKGVELAGIIVGIIVECTHPYHPFIGIIPVGAVVILIGSYIFFCIYAAWNKMKETPQPRPTTNLESVVLEKPPSYDSFANQTEVI